MFEQNDTCVMSNSKLIMLEYILKKNQDIYYVFFLPDVITKFYSVLIRDWIAIAPKMVVKLRDKFELEFFWPTAAK